MRYYLFSFLLILTIVSCSEAPTTSRVFHYNQPNNITNLDPAFARSLNNIWAVDHLFSTLVRLDEHGRIVPDLAKSWEVSQDGLIYTFHLETDVAYHHQRGGTHFPKLNAKDVVYSFSRIIDPDVGSPGSWIFKGKVDQDRPFEALDDSTFSLRLIAPFPPMLGILTMKYCSILPAAIEEVEGHDLRTQPVGSGPFKLINWQENQGLFLEPHEGYFKADEVNGNLEGVRVSFIRDRKTALLELISGKIDFISGYDQTYRATVLDEEGKVYEKLAGQVVLSKTPFLNTEYLGINLEKAKNEGHPLANRALRQALNYGIDRDLMLTAIKGGVGVPANSGFLANGMDIFEAGKGYTYDKVKAKELVNTSQYDGREFTLYTNKDYLDLCLFASRQWKDIGVNVRVELVESSLLRDMIRKGQIVFFRASWIADYPDPESFFTVFFGDNPAPPNYTRFRNADVDRLYKMALETTDHNHRKSLYQSIDSIIIEEAPVIFLYYDQTFHLMNRNIEGLKVNAFNVPDLRNIRMK